VPPSLNLLRLLLRLPERPASTIRTLLVEVPPVLGDQLVGIYLYGSVASGDFDEGVSDVDLLIAVSDDLSDRQLAGLDDAHRRLLVAHPDMTDRLDLVYASVAVLNGAATDAGRRPRVAAIRPGVPLQRQPEGWEWQLNWQLAREARLTLWGPPVEHLVMHRSSDDVRRLVAGQTAEVAGWAERENDRKRKSYAILTLSRGLHYMVTGREAGKAEAADWVGEQSPELQPLLDAALSWRWSQVHHESGPLAPDLAEQMTALIELAVGQADKLAPEAAAGA
jgi:predicted nucleotidyltransferase